MQKLLADFCMCYDGWKCQRELTFGERPRVVENWVFRHCVESKSKLGSKGKLLAEFWERYEGWKCQRELTFGERPRAGRKSTFTQNKKGEKL